MKKLLMLFLLISAKQMFALENTVNAYGNVTFNANMGYSDKQTIKDLRDTICKLICEKLKLINHVTAQNLEDNTLIKEITPMTLYNEKDIGYDQRLVDFNIKIVGAQQ